MKYYFFLLSLLLPILAHAQEQLGLRIENYAGTNSLSLNPTGQLHNPNPWDITIAGAGFFFENNYAFIERTNTLDLIKNRDLLSFDLADQVEQDAPTNTYIINFENNQRKRYLVANTFVAGPAVSLNIAENHTVGVFTNFRAMFSSLDVPNAFSYYKYDARSNFDAFPVSPFSASFLSWSEIGINYALRIPTQSGYMGFGINLKRLHGYEAGFLTTSASWTHTKLPEDNVLVENTIGSFGLTTSNLNGNDFSAANNGKGLGMDIGYTQTFETSDNRYTWRIGASLLDIGSIKFDKNAEQHTVNNPNSFQLNLRDFENYILPDEWNPFIEAFSQAATGDPEGSLSDNQFKIALPAAISLQADYAATENIFINGFFIHRLPTQHSGPQRATVLAVTPRYEHPWFSVSMPVSVVNWETTQVGLAARLGYLVIGSDNLGSFVGKSNYSGTDFYLALKLNRINFGDGFLNGALSGSRNKHGNKDKVKCYDF